VPESEDDILNLLHGKVPEKGTKRLSVQLPPAAPQPEDNSPLDVSEFLPRH